MHFLFRSLILSACLGVFLLSSSPASADLASASAWLKAAQQANGSWGGTSSSASPISATAAALEALRSIQQSQPAAEQKALAWLQAQTPATLDEIAHRLLAYTVAAQPPLASDLPALLAFQNPDGGFAPFSQSQSTSLDTALALRVLGLQLSTHLPVTQKALSYLQTQQRPDGGWAFPGSSNDSSAYLTSTVLLALAPYQRLFALQTLTSKAVNYLKTTQATDGSWATGRDKVLATAFSVVALGVIAPSESGLLSKGIGFLETTQAADGSWAQDPFATAYALRALDARKPDLTFDPASLSLNPSPLILATPGTVSITLRNQGSAPASGILVRLVRGDPQSGGTTLHQTTVPSLASGASQILQLPWTSPGPIGSHYLYLLVDPDQTITEINELNNSLTLAAKVVPPVDLAIGTKDLTLQPAFPTPNRPLNLSIRVRNLGGVEAKNVPVAFYRGHPQSGGTLLGPLQTIPSILGGQSAIASLDLPSGLPQGSYTLVVVVDPAQTLTDSDRSNNQIQHPFDVKDRIDLAVQTQGIFFSKTEVFEGDTMEIRVGVYNSEAQEARNAVLRVFDGDPQNGGIQIGSDILLNVPGQQAIYSPPIAYQGAGAVGTHFIYAVIDPDKTLADINRDNNTAIRTLKLIGLPDLSLQPADLSFTPTSPEQADSIRLFVNVQNLGQAASPATTARFFDRDPSTPGATPIAPDLAISALNPKASTRPSILLDPFPPGLKTLWVVLNPSQTFREILSSNNTAAISLSILPSSRPDLTLSANDIRISPPIPTAGSFLTVEADIYNLFGPSASSVIVRLHDGPPSALNLIQQIILPSIPSGGTAKASFAWNVPPSKLSSQLHVVVDPTNVIAETDETNNTASRSILFRLPLATAPTNFNVTATPPDTLAFQWQPGVGAAAAGVYGYRIYCNGGLLNPPTPVPTSSISTTVSSEESATYAASNLLDATTATFWRPNSTSAAPFVELAFPQPRPITGILIYFNTTVSGRSYKIQAWKNNAWQDLAQGTDPTTQEHYFTPVTTDKIRIAFTFSAATAAPAGAQTREIRIYESNLIQGTSFSQTALPRGDYSCYATAVLDPLRASPPSNTSSGRLGDFLPPAPATGVSATYVPTSFRTDLRWSPPTDPDLYGCRPLSGDLNVARWERGATASASSYQTTERLLDGTLTASSFARVASPGFFLVELARIFPLQRIVLHLGPGDQRLRVETSTDGLTYQVAADLSSPPVQGRHEIPFATPRPTRYIRLSSSQPEGSFLDIAEVEAFTSELSPLLTDTRLSPSSNFLNYNVLSNSWRAFTYDFSPGTDRPRRFMLFDVGLDPFDVLLIRDLDTHQILGRISGSHDLYTTDWLNAKRYRFEILPSRVTSNKGFRLILAVERTVSSTATYAHSPLYFNGRIDYAVACIDLSGNESPVTPAAFVQIQDQQAPNPPTNFRATATVRQVALTWSQTAPSDFKGFRLYRNGQLFKTLPSSPYSYTDTEVINGVKYTYELSSIDLNDNESAKVGPLEATPSGIDLTIVTSGSFSDVFFSPREPSVYETATIGLIVRNLGSEDAPPGVIVHLHDGDPKAGGTLIGTITFPSTIPAQTRAIGIFEWKLAAVSPGPHTVWATVNPTLAIPEYDATNNTASRSLTIHADPFLDTHVNQVNSSRFPVIELLMRVRDANGGGIFGLDERNFTLKEDQKIQSPLLITEIGQPGLGLPKVDIVFVIDTSGSMGDEWNTICSVIDEIRDLLLAYRVDLNYKIYSLQSRYGGATCGDPLTTGIFRGNPHSNDSEDWGPGTTWAIKNHPWRTGASRIVIPISDEGAFRGDGWTAEDTETVTEAITAATTSSVSTRFYPFWGSEIGGETSTNIVAQEMRRMAQATGGKAFPFLNATQVAQEIVDAALLSVSDYKITYTTSNPARDGTLRKIDVETKFNVSIGRAQGDYRAPLDNLPDLLFLGPLQITPETPLIGQRTQLQATIRNNGGKPVTSAIIHLYEGEPNQGGRLIGLVTLPSLAPGEEKPATFLWQAIPGLTRFVLLIDPANSIPESDEQNNSLRQDLLIPGSRGAELAVTSFDLSISPDPAIQGRQTTFQALIHNIGTKDARDVLIAFFLGNPDQGGRSLGTTTLPLIAAGTSQPAIFPWITESSGLLDLHVVIDPYNTVQEDFEDNNRAQRTFTVAQRQLGLQISTDLPRYPIQTDVKIHVQLQNQTPMLWSGSGEVWIEDAKKNPVHKVADLTIQNLLPAGLKEWPYRLPISWTSPPSGTLHLFLGVDIDLTTALQQVGQTGKAVDPASFRVMAFDDQGVSLGLIPFRFRPLASFDPISSAKGQLLLFLKENIGGGVKRTFYLFFDIAGASPKPPSLASPPFPSTGATVAWLEDQGRIFFRDRLPDGSLGPEVEAFDISANNDQTRALTLGDFNNDGHLDLIAASTFDRKLYFYPGDPLLPKRFDITKRRDVGAIGSTIAIAAVSGDLNKDGKLDVVVSSSTTSYIFLGNGDGSFQAPRTVSSPSGTPRGKILIDFNNDGHLDLLYSTQAASKTGRIIFHPGSASGLLAAGQSLISGGIEDPYGFAVFDFNGDGILDILANEGSSGIALLALGRSPRSFDPFVPVPSLSTPTFAAWAPADWNYDGRLDIFAATHTTKEIRYYEAQTDLLWATPQVLQTTALDFLAIAVAPPTAQLSASPGSASSLPSQSWNLVWNTQVASAAPYSATVKLFEQPQEKVAEASAPFTVEPDIKADAELTTDKIAYPPQASVFLRSRVINRSRNLSFDTLQTTVLIQDSQGQTLQTFSSSISNLGLGQLRDETLLWTTGSHPPGTYKALLKLTYQGSEIAQSSTTFDILSGQDSRTGIRGKLTLKPALAKPGTPVDISFEIVNSGNQALTHHAFTVRIYSNSDRSEKATYTQALTISPQDVGNDARRFDTTPLAEGEYTVVLSTLWGSSDIALDSALLTLKDKIDLPPLTLKITSPASGSLLPSPVTAVSGDLSDGDATVKVNGFDATVSGISAQPSNFTLSALSATACRFTITAEATRAQDRATDQITVSFDKDFLSPQTLQPLTPPKTVITPRIALGKGPVLWLPKPASGEILRLTLNSKSDTITQEDTLISGLRDPFAVLEDPQGRLIVALRSSSEILRFDLSTTPPTPTTLASSADGIAEPSFLLSDAQGGFFVANAGRGTLLHFDSQGKVSTRLSNLKRPIALACRAPCTTLLILEEGGSLLSSDSPAKTSTLASNLPGSPSSIAFVGDHLLLSDSLQGSLSTVAPDGSIQTILGGFPGLSALAALDNATLLFAPETRPLQRATFSFLACAPKEPSPEPSPDASEPSGETNLPESSPDASEPSGETNLPESSTKDFGQNEDPGTPDTPGQAPGGCGCSASPLHDLTFLLFLFLLLPLTFRRFRIQV